MNLIDTHCHIHDPQYDFPDDVVEQAQAAGVGQMTTVGTDVADSRAALDFAAQHDGVYATVGIHPGVETEESVAELEAVIASAAKQSRQKHNLAGLPRFARDDKLVGLADIGLDYHYQPYNRDKQIKLFEAQLELAVKYNLPVGFHVRESFDDFWPILDNFSGVRGTLHCYTDNVANLEKGLARGLFVSVNGIATFNTDPEMERVFAMIPLDRLLLETDAPYLAPKPHRGNPSQPAHVAEIARFWAQARGLSLDEVAQATTHNAKKLFGLL